jgi:transposase
MVVGMVVDDQGIPLCCEMWPGNTADVKTIKEVVGRLKDCFQIRDVCVVADRGMISAEMLEFLESEECPPAYILGVRLRAVREVREEVLSRAGRYSEIEPENPRREPLKVKEVRHKSRRYAVCVNEAQARKDAYDRERIAASLREKLKSGDKSLVGNAGYRKYLKAAGKGHFEVDGEKLAAEARFDGKWVLTSNAAMTGKEMALQYKRLWMVEAMFRTMKSTLETRPVFHRLDRTIRGHVFCSFLAILLRRELERRLDRRGHKFEWADVLRDLAAVEEVKADLGGRRVVFRSELRGCAGKVMQAAGVAVPPTVKFV